ncbi:MAG: hypothetical protein ACM3WU_00990 [Bacillota bacterium]
MPSQDLGFRGHPAYLDDDPQERESRPFRFPRKPGKSPAKKKRLPKSGGLAPDPKRYNDEIPDPDDEETVPE